MTTYNYALLRAVPHVHVGAFANVGVIVHARELEFLGMRVIDSADELRRRVPDADVEVMLRYLASLRAICNGDEAAGPLALAPTSERFHWLTAPRSDVLQASPVHVGMADDPATELDSLFAMLVASPEPT